MAAAEARGKRGWTRNGIQGPAGEDKFGSLKNTVGKAPHLDIGKVLFRKKENRIPDTLMALESPLKVTPVEVRGPPLKRELTDGALWVRSRPPQGGWLGRVRDSKGGKGSESCREEGSSSRKHGSGGAILLTIFRP